MSRSRRCAFVTLLGVILSIPPVQAQSSAAAGRIEVHEASVTELADALAAQRTTSVELVDAYLARIRAYDQAGPALNAIIRLNPNARAEAAALDRERRERGPRGVLHGIPVLMKDNYEVAGLATSAGSLALAGWVPTRDAAIVARLRAAGAVILGMTNMHELASGITTITSIGGQTLNPYDPTRNPGGSSGGTGAAIGASFAAIGWGTDTCGSIRIPAAHQNLFGLRPTSGKFSITGIVPLSHTQDTPGPLARSAMDLAIGLDATVGPESAVSDPATGQTRMPRFQAALRETTLRGARIGILTNYFGGGDEAEAGRIVRAALDSIETQGAEVLAVRIPDLDSVLARSSLINWEHKWDMIDFFAERPTAPIRSLREIIDRGLYARSMEGNLRNKDTIGARDTEGYRAALRQQARVREVLEIVFAANDLDAIAYPTVRRKAAPIGEGQQGSSCALAAASGFPAVTMPAGLTADGLPIGLELLGRPHSDEQLVGLAYAYEQMASPRRAPWFTPPLVQDRAPAPVSFTARAVGEDGARVEARFAFDVTRGTLSYAASVAGVLPELVHAATLDMVEEGRKGGVVYRLVRPGEREGEGTMRLTSAQREALLGGRLSLNLYTRDRPAGAAMAAVVVPRGAQK